MDRPLVALSPEFWDGRRVLVTGHTGFKGAWLCLLLEHLNADECYALANGVWVMEALARMTVVMGVDPDPHALGLVPAN